MREGFVFFKWKYIARWFMDKPLKDSTQLHMHYTIDKCLGKGGYGIVYLCIDNRINEKYVVKQLRPSRRKEEKERDRFQEEVRLLKCMEHSAIPQLIDSFIEGEQYFYVMECMKGWNLEDELFYHQRKFTEKETLILMLQLLSIIEYMHALHIFHFDIRPPNVLIDGEKISLIDFGLAKQLSTNDGKQRKHWRQDDYFDFGQMILFLLYSQYDGKRRKNGTWVEELSLPPEIEGLLKRLLGIEKEYEAIEEIRRDLKAAIQLYQ